MVLVIFLDFLVLPQTTMYYSRPKNMIRLTMVDQKVKSDLYFYFADDEVFAFDYSFGGRGNHLFIVVYSPPFTKLPEEIYNLHHQTIDCRMKN